MMSKSSRHAARDCYGGFLVLKSHFNPTGCMFAERLTALAGVKWKPRPGVRMRVSKRSM